MPITTNAIFKEKTKFISPFRVILSGSSGAGKTYFAENLIRANLFEEAINFIYYFHPCYLDEAPVDWHESMTLPVSYQTGLPTIEQLTSMPEKSLVILDDLMDKCVLSEAIDHLFRVISGKRKISVMIMTQNYFINGRFSRNIRNSCNYSVLMRNCCDATINSRAARAMNLSKAVTVAELSNSEKEFPYLFIDQTQKGQVSGYQIYTDIFGMYMKCFSNAGMPAYIVPEKDFLAVFEILQRKNRVVLAKEKIAGSNSSSNPKNSIESVRLDTQKGREYSRRPRKRTKRN